MKDNPLSSPFSSPFYMIPFLERKKAPHPDQRRELSPPRAPPPCHAPHPLYKGIYITGLSILLVFTFHFKLWPVFGPTLFEVVCLMYLTAFKIFNEKGDAVELTEPRQTRAQNKGGEL